ncbi:hypothetical protein [Pseudomonas sp. PSB1]|uniref:hypothetical protein n=1 Tax=Pseudomonas sp. PSB1 TaxID=477819 RepID=UPI0016605DA5|nr:hypothetical protein [Pseudomonas sp. PSB1]MBD0704380.1 hypothetical protein [Pseudomonas sp. PSB1]
MDAKLKHLEFVQGVVNRLSTNSFLLKGWAVVIVSALFALSAKDANTSFAALAYIPALAFWGLDAYFLALERNYRKLYERVRGIAPEQVDFAMVIEVKEGSKDWWRAFFSKTLIIFHGAIVAAISLVIFVYHRQ